jgi:pyruvate,water dikinase
MTESEIEILPFYSFRSVVGEEFPEAVSASLRRAPLSEVGGKGLSLIQSANRRFPVPKGFVLPVNFFEPWVEACLDERKNKAWKVFAQKARAIQYGWQESNVTISKEDCDVLKKECRKRCSFTKTQEELLQKAIAGTFGDDNSNGTVVVAVRSSSPEEDLAGTSFAGGYETTLGVSLDTTSGTKKNQGFTEALMTCFLSMLDYRIVQYKLQQQQKNKGKDAAPVMDILKPRIAVVVQEQIDSQTSGVAFSINPQNNCYDEIVITANYGLGESVVSGIVTPDVYTVEHRSPNEFIVLDQKIGSKQETIWLDTKQEGDVGTVQKSSQEPSQEAALSEAQILEIARMVAKVEACSKDSPLSVSPVDVEWAFHDGTLYLLQARPVTSYIPLFPEMITPRGAAKKNLYLDLMVMTQGFCESFSTLGLDIWNVVLGYMKPGMFTNQGPNGALWSLHGRQYIHVSNYFKSTGGEATITKLMGNYDPAIGRAFESIDLEDYTPVEVPDGVRGLLWKNVKMIGKILPGTFRSGITMLKMKNLFRSPSFSFRFVLSIL